MSVPYQRLAPGFSWRRLFTNTFIAILLVAYPVFWLRVMVDPSKRAIDFLPFYAAGQIANTQGMAQVYDWESQRQAEDEILNENWIQYFASQGRTVTAADLGPPITAEQVNPFPHPPFIVPLLSLFAHLDYLTAFGLWALLTSLVFTLCASILIRLIPEASARNKWVLFFGLLLFFPSFYSVINGQDTSILLLGACLWTAYFVRGQDLFSGLGLALVVIRPHLAVLLAPPFIFRRRKVWWGFCAGAGLLVIVSLFLLRNGGIRSYINILLTSANGQGNVFFNEDLMVNLIGFLRRLLPSVQPSVTRLVGWIGYIAGIIYLCIVWLRTGELAQKHIGLAVVLSVVAAPHLHYHDLALLLIPMVGAIRTLLDKKLARLETAVLFPLIVSFCLFVSFFISHILLLDLPYLLMALLLALLWFPERTLFWLRNPRPVPVS